MYSSSSLLVYVVHSDHSGADLCVVKFEAQLQVVISPDGSQTFLVADTVPVASGSHPDAEIYAVNTEGVCTR